MKNRLPLQNAVYCPETIARIPEIIDRLNSAVDELEKLFPGRHFTLDGHLVGSLGEVWAAYLYGIRLGKASMAGHDGRSPDGRNVQIKATQGNMVSMRSEPEHLIVLQLTRSGQPQEVYNGPGAAPWRAAGRLQSNGQRSIGLARLRALMTAVPRGLRLERRSLENETPPRQSHTSIANQAERQRTQP